MTELICDTNVFYNLGAKTLTKAQLAPANETICYSPITSLELAGKWSNRTHPERRAAAEAILMSGAKELPDPETHLVALFGYTAADPRTTAVILSCSSIRWMTTMSLPRTRKSGRPWPITRASETACALCNVQSSGRVTPRRRAVSSTPTTSGAKERPGLE